MPSFAIDNYTSFYAREHVRNQRTLVCIVQYIAGILSQAPVIDMKCNFFTGMGVVARSPVASAIYHHR